MNQSARTDAMYSEPTWTFMLYISTVNQNQYWLYRILFRCWFFSFFPVLYVVLGTPRVTVDSSYEWRHCVSWRLVPRQHICMHAVRQSQTYIVKRVCFHSHSIHINRTTSNFGWKLCFRFIYILWYLKIK